MDALALRGVPLAVAPSVTVGDTHSAAYAAAQLAFELARGAGTPLLPSPTVTDDRGPVPYVRQVLTAMLVRHAGGDDPRPIGEAEMSAAAEAHLALIEAVSSEAANYTGITAEAPAFPATVSPSRFGAIEYPRAPWLSETLLRSAIRIGATEPPRSTAPVPAQADPLLRLAAESAHWRGVPPHGSRDKLAAESLAAAMSAVASAPRLAIPVQDAVTEGAALPPDETWLHTAALQMAGSVGSMLHSGIAEPTADGIRLAVLEKMSAHSATVERDSRAYVIDATTVRSFLSDFDVMRDYVFQPV